MKCTIKNTERKMVESADGREQNVSERNNRITWISWRSSEMEGVFFYSKPIERNLCSLTAIPCHGLIKTRVPSIVLRKFNSGYNRLAASDLDGRLASRLQCTCPGLDARRTVRYRSAGGCGPLFLEN